jgi:TolB-like protein/DNA-binding winged helix-turn-helix (wHTH) protein
VGRRALAAQVQFRSFGPFRVHAAQGLWCDDREIRITPKSLAVLCALAARPGTVVTKEELFAEVWRGRVVSDAALSSCIRELRRAIDDDARNPRYIETVHRRGFRLLHRHTNVSGAAGPDASMARPVVAGDTIGSDECRMRAGTVSGQRRSFAEATPSIVILPFESISDEAPGSAIARGLVHDITTRVARSRVMFVIARGTAFQFAGRPQDVRRTGKRLGVRYVVQGAVQISGSRLGVSVSLADTLDGTELWSERYERRLDDFMLIQEEIAKIVVACIETEVERQEIQRSLLMPSLNLDAWSAFHRGLHHMYRFQHDDCEAAERLFLSSIRMEPGVPRPYAALSFVNFERAFLGFDAARSNFVDKAFAYALQSLSIDERDPMGHWALSRAHLLRGELDAARLSLETAIDLNPSYAIAQYSLGWVALQLGERELCLERVGFARRLSPYDPLKFAMLGVSALNLALMGRTADAVELSKRSTLQANAHHLAYAFAAITHALGGAS